MEVITTRCCIVGGGPAGMMLGFLLARSGVETMVLEKWPDFFRDFRGDTIHPSTMELLFELGLLEHFLQIPHSKSYQLKGVIGSQIITLADFSHLKVHCPFIAFVPQWDFLNFIAEQARQYSHFQLCMETEGVGLIEEQDRVVGVYAKTKEREYAIRAELVVSADGRHSIMRAQSGLAIQNLSAPMDVLWFKLSRKQADPQQSLGRIEQGYMMVMIERGTYWQCGFIIPKGQFNKIHEAGLDAFRHSLLEIIPTMEDRVEEIQTWDQIKLLEVSISRLSKWYRAGFLCIGDSAHTMSPIGGVGINLAIQDAVASANHLVPAFLNGKVTESVLAAIQQRRQWPTRVIQQLQRWIQNKVIKNVLGKHQHLNVPWMLKLLQWVPYLQRIPANIIGMGCRPEQIQTIAKKYCSKHIDG